MFHNFKKNITYNLSSNNKVTEGFESESSNKYAVAETNCPSDWNLAGPYNDSLICSNNCNGTFSYINANPDGYSSEDKTNYCTNAKVYNPLTVEKFNNSNNSNNLTKGLPIKTQKYLLTQTSLANM